MQKSWWNKQYGIIIAAIVLLMMIASCIRTLFWIQKRFMRMNDCIM